ncbi:MAG: hypothetical protein IPK26_23380 [Planctomycetes bacterium]|nr:hypothetical protein [Planctomycetota bacterium]
MNENPQSGGSVATPTFVEDVFLTETFLIKGRLPNKSRRLTNILEDHNRAFLQVQDATMVSLRSAEVIRTPSVMVNAKEVVFAHELVELAGDETQRRLAAAGNAKANRIRAFYSGVVQFELAGNIEPGAYESTPNNNRRWFIMQKPTLRGLDLANPELSLLRSLDYAIVRKDKMAYVYDFS